MERRRSRHSSDTIHVLAALRGWCAGGLCTCDSVARKVKPEWGDAAFHQGEENEIHIALEAMKSIALFDQSQAA